MPNYDALVSLEEFLDQPLDYVIVGCGTASLVSDARLIEEPNTTVGVLGAGKSRFGDENVESMGGRYCNMLHNQKQDWVFKTVPQV